MTTFCACYGESSSATLAAPVLVVDDEGDMRTSFASPRPNLPRSRPMRTLWGIAGVVQSSKISDPSAVTS